MTTPTDKQLELMRCIQRHIENEDNFPTMIVLAKDLGIQANAVNGRLKLLVKKGLLVRPQHNRTKWKRTERFKTILNSLGD